VSFVILLALSALTNALPIFDIILDPETGQLQTFDPNAAPAGQFYIVSALALGAMLLTIGVLMVYLCAAIRDASSADYKGIECVLTAVKSYLRLIGVSLIKFIVNVLCFVPMLLINIFLLGYEYSAFLYFALLLLSLVPLAYFSIMFFFAESSILDNKCRGVFQSLKYSRDLTKGRRGEIFKVIAYCILMVLLIVMLLLYVLTTTHQIIFQFIIIFVFTIITLMQQKLTANLYVDTVSAYEARISISGEL